MNAAGHHPDMAIKRALQSWAAEVDATIFVDVSCMLQDQWTGIPAVAAGLSRALLELWGGRVRFFSAHHELDSHLVTEALDRHDGGDLGYEFRTGGAGLKPIRPSAGMSIGIYPTVKSARRLFDYECSIVHDLSTLITPQFHDRGNIHHHMENLRDDIASDSLTICVSEATRQDLIDYLGVEKHRTLVAYPAANWHDDDIAAAKRVREFTRIEPYFLILGTREARKNNGLIMAMLELDPAMLDRFRFVFTGKEGLLAGIAQSPVMRRAIEQGRISFTGYVSETDKCALVINAEATIYPSFFEGFGLPVIESLALGTPCLASCSSSLPEIGSDVCLYFDPFSAVDLRRCVREFIALRADNEWSARCRARAEKFRWSHMAVEILASMRAAIPDAAIRRSAR